MTLPDRSLFTSLRQAHPRLVLLPGEEDRIRQLIQADPVAQKYFARLRADGERILAQPLPQRVLIGREPSYMYMLLTSREVLDRVYTLGLLYRLNRERRWAERAIGELLNAARFVDWNPAHWLDTAEMFHAQAIGYDWLYDAFTPEQRSEIEQVVLLRGFEEAEKAYAANLWWTKNPFNWNNVCNGGVIAGALGFAELAPDRAERLVRRAIEGLPYALANFAPDGAWAEGPGYWGYAMRYTQTALSCLDTALDSDFGLGELPGLAEAGWFRLHATGPFGWFFNFADASLEAPFEPTLFWLGRRYQNPAFTLAALDSDCAVTDDAPFGAAARSLIFYQPVSGAAQAAPLDAFYKKTNLVFMRSAWHDPQAFFVGFKGGDNQANHSHCDLGEFVFDALGERWAVELGRDEYTLLGYWETAGRRWSYPRLATAGHNTLLLDGQNQDHTAEAPVIAFASTPAGAYAAADLTAGYAGCGATRVTRRIELGDGRRALSVQDQVEASRPVQVTWQMYTHAEVELKGDIALLRQNGKQMRVDLLAPAGAAFAVEEMHLDPPQLPLENTRRLRVILPPAHSAEIHVRLSPTN
jgi:hypothetical protein